MSLPIYKRHLSLINARLICLMLIYNFISNLNKISILSKYFIILQNKK